MRFEESRAVRVLRSLWVLDHLRRVKPIREGFFYAVARHMWCLDVDPVLC